MAVIGPCKYNDRGQLIRPDSSDVRAAKMALDFDTGEAPTLKRGYTHVFVIRDGGPTPEIAQRNVNQKLQRFFMRIETSRGYTKISMDKRISERPMHNGVSITYEIVYADEMLGRKRDREQRRSGTRPESPNAGSQRGMRAVARY